MQDIAVGKLTVRQRRVVVVGDADLGDLAGARGELRVGGMDQIRGPAGTLEPDHAAHMVAVAMSGDDVVDADIRKLLAVLQSLVDKGNSVISIEHKVSPEILPLYDTILELKDKRLVERA